jgi:hypothetical protein
MLSDTDINTLVWKLDEDRNFFDRHPHRQWRLRPFLAVEMRVRSWARWTTVRSWSPHLRSRKFVMVRLPDHAEREDETIERAFSLLRRSPREP